MFKVGDLLVIQDALDDRITWNNYICHYLWKSKNLTQHNKSHYYMWDKKQTDLSWLVLYSDIFREFK